MNRRQVLQGISGLIGAACSAIVAVPGVSYVMATIGKQKGGQTAMRRVAPLAALRPGQPAVMAITGSRQDAWTTYRQEVVGRVWLVRRSDESTPPDQAQVQAFSTVCPHLGCETQTDKAGQGFFCPCHKAKFALSGEKAAAKPGGEKNHAPRGLDALECRVAQDAVSGEWWVEVKYETFERGLTKKVVAG
jgi:menaquinol-cytochrome c reductase iron-sulfur subunit